MSSTVCHRSVRSERERKKFSLNTFSFPITCTVGGIRLRLKLFATAMVSMLSPNRVQKTRGFMGDYFTVVNVVRTRRRNRSTIKHSGTWLETGTRMKRNKKKKRLFFGDSRNASLGFVFGHETEKAVSSPSALRSHTNGNEGGRPDRWMEDGRAKRRVWRIYAERRRALR